MSKKYRGSRQSPEYRRRLAIGRALAAVLPQNKTQLEVAKELGMSRFKVAEIEALALYKLFAMAHRMKREGLMDGVMDSNVEGERSFFALHGQEQCAIMEYEEIV